MTSTYDPLVGQVLDDRYEIIAKLDRGGMATVYRARDRRLSRIVALKVMRSDLGEDDEFTAKFDREARAAAVLSHPNVVAVFDQGASFGQPYIVMEYVDGETLRRMISRDAPFAPDAALGIMEAIASALASAHEEGVIHRDIKPENVLVSTRGQVKVADFGLARRVDSPQVTSTGVLVGTASYLPPELVTHARPDARSDVYSAGVVLFELLTGEKPHQGETNYQIAFQHVTVDIERPSQRLKTTAWRIPDYLDALVQAATSRDPENRVADGRELLQLVRRCRAELAKSGDVDNPELAAELRPDPADSNHTMPIMPKPAGRPRPSGAPSASPVYPSPVSSHSASSPMPSPLSFRSLEPDAAPDDSSYDDEPPAPATPPSPRQGYPRSHSTPVFGNVKLSADPTHRRRRGIVLLVLVLLLTALVSVGSWWWTAGRFTTVPDLAKVSEAEASTAAEANALGITTASEYSETVEKGLVISTDPAAGERVLRGEQVTVIISLGPERFDMPEVVGLTLDEATTKLRDNTLALGEVTEKWSETKPIGEVLAAAEQPGTKLKRDTPVGLTVSKGPKPIEIESFVGRSADQAVKDLEKAGFTTTMKEEHSGSVEKGMVISQTPSSGTGKKGDQIALVRSLGPEMVDVPTVLGSLPLPVADVEKEVKALGFETETTRGTLQLPGPTYVVDAKYKVGDTEVEPNADGKIPANAVVVLVTT
ncbi:Stk1 family PASTA domain-containing Ser/Thr kinase [Tessaracoccus caeni]|uniref:Stk1 family PASTA domain-containing Ser/Thr kinase n=1 Tax=Tessaracoccus caeni TaxID=3031239 RepID=UPI0023DCB2CD|nr:Stk1 family PASTA domain-containing Ser/Thr kinase [Tessaracoccus caeni]MDF1486834.1 Stk1 family PASTA domain-containing Ser/Thr kinase [Tessaracoccus caeni]